MTNGWWKRRLGERGVRSPPTGEGRTKKYLRRSLRHRYLPRMSLRISLFGRIQIHDENEPRHEEASTKGCELLAYLLLNRNRSHPREKLASVLWGRVRTDSSKAYLRKALWKLRKVLDREGRPFILDVDREWVGVNADAEYALDVEEFERAFSEVRDRKPQNLSDDEVGTLGRCARLYEGNLLENLYRDWCAMDRQRLQHFYLIVLDKLTDRCEMEGRHEAGLQWAHGALQIDPARECTHRRIMRLRYRAGDRTGALRQYRNCRETLEAHLEVAPTTETEELRDRIREGAPIPVGGLNGNAWGGDGAGQRARTNWMRLREPEETLPRLHDEFREELRALTNGANGRAGGG